MTQKGRKCDNKRRRRCDKKGEEGSQKGEVCVRKKGGGVCECTKAESCSVVTL